MNRLAVVVVTVSVLVAACTTEQTSNPSPALTSTTSTSTTTSTTSTTTTTVAETTTSTTTPETTVPSGPSPDSFPLFIGGANGGWLLFGTWAGDSWDDDTDDDGVFIQLSIEPGPEFTVSNLDGRTQGPVGEAAEACFDGRQGPTIGVTVAAPEPPGFGYAAIALPTRPWLLTPRPIAVTGSGPATYKALGEAAFDGEPVDAALGSVEQVVVTDIDGDGDDEALVVYEYVQPSAGPGAPGDLATVLLVDTATREATTIRQSFVDEDLDPDAFPLIERFRILDVADYNGDGRMEVAVHAWYYEGASVILYEYDGTELTEVLATGCGA